MREDAPVCPCAWCQRWQECNGVAGESCELFASWKQRNDEHEALVDELLEDKTESGLFEDD